MCDGTYGSDPAHPQFWHNWLPNEEQIGKPKNYFLGSIFQKNCVRTIREPQKQSKNWCIRLLWYANIKKASQDEQQIQTTTTTNINCIKNFMSVLKNEI